MKLAKDMLKPGVYNERGRIVEVTKADIDNLESSFNVLANEGYKIPVWLEHEVRYGEPEPTAFPIKSTDAALLSQAEGSPWFAGWLSGMNRDSNDMLVPELDVPDSLGEKLKTAGTFVSPFFGEWAPIKDKAPMALLHLALTRSPVNQDQTNQFVEKKVSSGLDESSPLTQHANNAGQPMRLTEAMQSGIKSFSFSLGNAVNGYCGQSGASGASVPTSGNPGQQTPQNSMVPNAGQQIDPHADLKTKFQSVLQALGLQVDQNAKILQDVEAMQRLVQVFMSAEVDATQKVHQGQSQDGSGVDPYNEQSTVIAMSQTNTNPQVPAQVAPVVNPLEPKLQELETKLHTFSAALVTADAVQKGLLGVITGLKRDGFSTRIDDLVKTGRCTAEDSTKLKELANQFQFSAVSDPNAKTQLDLELEIRAKLPEGACWNPAERVQQEQITTHTFGANLSPMSSIGDVSDEQADAIVAELNKAGRFYNSSVAANVHAAAAAMGLPSAPSLK